MLSPRDSLYRLSRHSEFSSKLLFLKLLKRLRPSLVMDVGSRNGAESLDFRSLLSSSRLIAIEANPHLAETMKKSEDLRKAKIEVIHAAISNANGTATIEIQQADIGNSSLRAYHGATGNERVEAPMLRLDSVISSIPAKDIALWIDVEGLGFEALEGLGSRLADVALIHIEVEYRPLWDNQKTAFEVEELLLQNGFCLYAAYENREVGQGNTIAIRKDLMPGMAKRFSLFAETVLQERLSILKRRLKETVAK